MTVCLILLAVLLLSALSGIAATVYVNILTQPGQVLGWWAKWLYSLRDDYADSRVWHAKPDGPDDPRSFDDVRQKAEEQFGYFLKPILTCVYCVGGQMGFWLSVYMDMSLILCLLTAVLSVFWAGLFQYVQQKLFPL